MTVSKWVIESLVGFFLLLAFSLFLFLAFKVSGASLFFSNKTYQVTANFEDIGGLKVRSPVKIGGVQIGEVSHISLDSQTFKAIVTMRLFENFNQIPDDSTAAIYTSGLLGDNFVSITPMYHTSFLKNGSHIEMTNSAMGLEKLIGQFIYSMNDNKQQSKEESKK